MDTVKAKRHLCRLAWWIVCAPVVGVVFLAFDDAAKPFPLHYPANFGGRINIPTNNPLTVEGVALGRKLFHETQLSSNNQISCASCHEQKRAFTDGKRFSKGVDGALTSRNTMSLANLLWVRNFFWDGRAASLEEQAIFPLTNPHEMGQSLDMSAKRLQKNTEYGSLFQDTFGDEAITPDRITMALAQFERTLISADSPYDHFLSGTYIPSSEEMRGMQLFMDAPVPEKGKRGANCGHCHGGPKTFKELFHNNGLDASASDKGREVITGQPEDRGRFRVPTLRNIALTAPYMHDGRFAILDQVLDHYNEHVQPSSTLSTFLKGVSNELNGKTLALSGNDKKDLLAFLHMLTDSTFINNPEFSNPNLK